MGHRHGGGGCWPSLRDNRSLLLLNMVLVVTCCMHATVHAKLSKMKVLDSPIRDTQWIGPSDEIIFTLTESGQLWISRDGGLEWDDVCNKHKIVGCSDSNPAHGAYEPSKGIQAILSHPASPGKVFLRGAADIHWVTLDFGETFSKVQGPAGHLGVATVRMHPTETDWILVMARRWSCWSQDANARSQCADDLFLTTDFGKSWRNLTEESNGRILGFVDFDWGWSKDPDSPKHHSSFTKDTILSAVYENRADVRDHLRSNGVGVVAAWDQYVDFVHTSDYFHSAHTKIIACGNQFEIIHDRLFLAVAEHCGSTSNREFGPIGGVKLKVSKDYGATFVDACFPEPLIERGYSVVHANQDTAFINVDYAQGSRMSPFGDLLVSDDSFTFFSLSMRRNGRSITGAVDFAAVQGLPGIYIANQMSDVEEEEAVRPAGTEEETATNFAKSTTMITFDGGSRWQPLAPPKYDSERRMIECSQSHGCSLHLHGTTSWIGGGGFAFVYSHASTPGMIISTGNVGTFLFQDSTVNTYLSRDAGQTWEEIAKGAHIYEFGDSGGVIVMTKHGLHTSTSSVLYSLDEGLSWEEEKFTTESEPVDIYNIRVEPDNQGKKFLVQGLTVDDGSGTSRRGVLITLNFHELSEYKDCVRSDYEWWTPCFDRCFLGTNITLQRQTRTAKCWNGERYQRPAPETKHCTCSLSDFQCDFGTEMDPRYPDEGCAPIPGFDPHSCAAYVQHATSTSDRGLRRAAGDVCEGSLPPAPGSSSGGSSGGGGGGGISSHTGGGFWGGGSVSKPSGGDVHVYPGKRPEPPQVHHNANSGSGSSSSSGGHSSTTSPSTSSSSGGGGHSHWTWLGTLLGLVVFLALGAAAVAFLAYRGLLPDWVVQAVPFLEGVRYASLRSNFQSLANDFGLPGGDDEYEEMYRQP